jgi:UDP-N-acetylglucosamine transferase subunit ALG13
MDLMHQARGVVTHGGPATILDAREAGHVPIVVPRRRAWGEHVDDHQVAFCRRVFEEGLIKLASTEDELLNLLNQATKVEADPVRPAVAPGVGAFIACAQSLLRAPPRRVPIRLTAHRLS